MRLPKWILAVWMLGLASSAMGEVQRIEIEASTDVLGGAAFGDVGGYRKITGRVYFVFDPGNAANSRIVDLDRAPRNAQGKVEAWGDFMVLHPKDPAKGSGTALVEVSNRGGKAALAYFNAGRFQSDPETEADFGDGLLMRSGLTIIWVGWQFDVPRLPGRLRLHVPIVKDGERTIEGLVRADWVVDQPTKRLAIGHRNHDAYAVARPDHPDNRLTVRDGRLAPRQLVPRSDWGFVESTHIEMPDGFEAGRIYELVYRGKDPAVVGLGLAAVRDMIAFAKHDERCPFQVRHGLAVGISQTGRFLRQFLYQGFNVDERGRKAFDGLLIHTAGAGRGSFNHRFGQPSRDAHRYSAFFFPTDLFPFSGRSQRDPVSGTRAGLLDRLKASGHLPKIFYTNTGYEYWGRAASLLHTSLDGSADVEPLPEERIYHLASSQHFVRRFAPPRSSDRVPGADAYRGNPLDFLVTERALLLALKAWVEEDRAPPPSAIPRIDAGTLVPIGQVRFPEIPGVEFPAVIHEAYRADYGGDWPRGIVTRQPPALGPAFPALVSQVDMVGNEKAGVPSVEILVPVATYTPWHLRANVPGGIGELTDY